MARDRSIWREELVEEIANEVHKRGWKVDAHGLVRTELALTLQALVAPGEPAEGVWALLRGYLWVPENRSWVLSCEFVGEILGPR